jgi:hypothetical protein
MDQLLSSQPADDVTGRLPCGKRSSRSQPLVSSKMDRATHDSTPIRAPLSRYVHPAVAATATGLTVKAIERKIEDGRWVEGREYRRAPDGHIHIDMRGFEKWVKTEAA